MKSKKFIKVYQIEWGEQIIWEKNKRSILTTIKKQLDYMGVPIQIMPRLMSKKEWNALDFCNGLEE